MDSETITAYRIMYGHPEGMGVIVNQLLNEIERLQTKINSHAPEGRNYTNAQYIELLLENERYLEAFKRVESLTQFHDAAITNEVHVIAKGMLGKQL